MSLVSGEPSALPYWQEVTNRIGKQVETRLISGAEFENETRDDDPSAVCSKSNPQSNTVWKQWSQ